jgi:hypothetical protein
MTLHGFLQDGAPTRMAYQSHWSYRRVNILIRVFLNALALAGGKIVHHQGAQDRAEAKKVELKNREA